MSRRSVTNDRYRIERSGKTRKSASAAKPKRAAGESSSTPAKKKGGGSKPKSVMGRLFGRGPAQPVPKIEPTPEMKKLRRWWWVFMGVAVALAFAMVPLSKVNNTVSSFLFGTYAAALGGALYIEFGPLRKARMAAAKAAKGGKSAKSAGAKSAPASAAKEDAASDGKSDPAASPGARGLAAVRGLFPLRAKPSVSDNDAAESAGKRAGSGKDDSGA